MRKNVPRVRSAPRTKLGSRAASECPRHQGALITPIRMRRRQSRKSGVDEVGRPVRRRRSEPKVNEVDLYLAPPSKRKHRHGVRTSSSASQRKPFGSARRGSVWCSGTCQPRIALNRVWFPDHGGRAVLSLVALVVATNDAEMVACGVRERRPPAAICVATISDLDRTERQNPVDLVGAASVARGEVEVYSTRRVLELVYFNEQEAVVAVRVEDHALLVASLVRVALNIDVAENLLPPLRQREGVKRS